MGGCKSVTCRANNLSDGQADKGATLTAVEVLLLCESWQAHDGHSVHMQTRNVGWANRKRDLLSSVSGRLNEPPTGLSSLSLFAVSETGIPVEVKE